MAGKKLNELFKKYEEIISYFKENDIQFGFIGDEIIPLKNYNLTKNRKSK